MEQSKVSLEQTIEESFYKEDLPESAMEDIKNMKPDFQKGMFEGMSFAYEQVANYISIALKTSDALTDKNVVDLIEQISGNRFANVEVSETEFNTYQEGFSTGAKSGFNLTKWEIEETFKIGS